MREEAVRWWEFDLSRQQKKDAIVKHLGYFRKVTGREIEEIYRNTQLINKK